MSDLNEITAVEQDLADKQSGWAANPHGLAAPEVNVATTGFAATEPENLGWMSERAPADTRDKTPEECADICGPQPAPYAAADVRRMAFDAAVSLAIKCGYEDAAAIIKDARVFEAYLNGGAE